MRRLERVGSISLADLFVVCRLLGLEHLPFPFFSRTQLEGSAGRDGTGVSVRDRFHDGDLHAFRRWLSTYPVADIRVTCRVVDPLTDPNTPHTRLLAFRAEQLGFFASQRADEDVVDVFTAAPYELGAAIASSARLTGPGSRSRIRVPSYARHFTKPTRGAFDTADNNDDYLVAVPVSRPTTATASTAAAVADTEVATLGAVQSAWEPPRSWGMDLTKNTVVWVRISDDGDYVFAPDFSYATPVTEQELGTRIDQLIAQDVAALRRHRGLG